MVETVTPAVCGSRKRQLLALGLFALGAVASAAALGAVLGLVGAAIGTGAALVAAVVLAVLGALREAGVVRFRIPQSRRQVPERWRSELPLPVWSTGYGAGLGLGFLTYQPVATFWVACAAALALGRPVAGAVAFGLYGVGRAAVLLLPVRRGADPAAIVEGLAGRRRTLLRVNAVALGACACLLAAAPVSAARVMPLGPGDHMDPSAHGAGFAYTSRVGATPRVVVRPLGGGAKVVFRNAESPALDGRFLAYQDSRGIRVVRWRIAAQVTRLRGRLQKPALDWPWLVFRKYYGHQVARPNRPDHAGHERYTLHLRNLKNGAQRRLAFVGNGGEIGRPSILGKRIAWHVAGENGSRIVLYRISTRSKKILFRSRIALLSNPAITRDRIVWTRDLPGGSILFTRKLRGGSTRALASVERPGSDFWFWTTELFGGRAYVTRWDTRRGVSRILRVGL
jgi:cytochrome c biogenesis protein CcdA